MGHKWYVIGNLILFLLFCFNLGHFYVNYSFIPVVHFPKNFWYFFEFSIFSNCYRVAQHHIQDPNILMLKNNEHLRRTRLSFKIFNNFRVKDKNFIMNVLFLQLTEISQCKKCDQGQHHQKLGIDIMNLIIWYTENTIPFLPTFVKTA